MYFFLMCLAFETVLSDVENIQTEQDRLGAMATLVNFKVRLTICMVKEGFISMAPGNATHQR